MDFTIKSFVMNRSPLESGEAVFMKELCNVKMMDRSYWYRRLSKIESSNHRLDRLVACGIYQFHYHQYCIRDLRASDHRYTFPLRKLYMNQWPFKTDSCPIFETKANQIKEKILVKNILYPHPTLEKTLRHFLKKNCFFLPPMLPEKIDILKKRYQKIKAVEDDDAEWLAVLKSTNDHEFIVHNVEYRLGGNLDNQNLWMMYIEYLKGSGDLETLLQTYSKYCRFFEDHGEIFEEYKFLAELNPPVAVPWTNPFSFEVHDESFFNEKTPVFPSICTSTAQSQIFHFDIETMIQLRENASPQVLHKLYQCCKWFPIRYPVTLCHQLLVETVEDERSEMKFTGDNIRITNMAADDISIKKIMIADSIIIRNSPPDFLSKFLPKIICCTAKTVEINDQKLRWEELLQLIQHGNVEKIHLLVLPGYHGLQEPDDYFVEDVLTMMPKVRDIYLGGIQCNPNTFKILNGMEFKNKFDSIQITLLTSDNFDPEGLGHFFVKNSERGATTLWGVRFPRANEYAKKIKDILSTGRKFNFCNSDSD